MRPGLQTMLRGLAVAGLLAAALLPAGATAQTRPSSCGWAAQIAGDLLNVAFTWPYASPPGSYQPAGVPGIG